MKPLQQYVWHKVKMYKNQSNLTSLTASTEDTFQSSKDQQTAHVNSFKHGAGHNMRLDTYYIAN